MEHTTMIDRNGRWMRRAALVAAVIPFLAACSSFVDNEAMGTRPGPAASNANVDFSRYAAIGTSLGAGIESGGINDSTQRETYTYQLAVAMGLTPGVDWFYPSLAAPGCPAPYTNVFTGARLSGAPSSACALRTAGSARPYVSNVSIPSLRAAQALDITNLAFPATDTLKLAQFITGSISPITMVAGQGATFVTLEVGANDVLGAATRGDTTLLTATNNFTASITAIAATLDSIGAKVAMSNVPNVTVIPHFTKASTLWGYKNVTCPSLPPSVAATIPYCSPLFSPSASCAPAAAGGVGDSYLLPFPTTAAVTSTLAAARAASITCGSRDSVLVATSATPTVPSVSAGASINTAEYSAITARTAALNAAISALATAHSYAKVNLDSALTANAALIPPLPCFAAGLVPNCTPAQPFGTVFSQDGIHPTRAGYRVMAQAFAAEVNKSFGTSLAIP